MEVKIQKQLVEYFSFFCEFHSAARNTLKDCQNCAVTINKLIKRCGNIKSADVATSPLAQFEDLQNKLCVALHNLISVSVSEIRCKLSTLENLYEKLSIRNKALREICRESSLDNNSVLVKGSPIQPPLFQLLEFADHTITFGSQACAQIETALHTLATTKLTTLNFDNHFSYPHNWHRRITEILSYTSFLSET